MDIIIIISIFVNVLFGIAAILFAIKEETVRKSLIEREKKQKQRLYEETLLREIEDRINYTPEIDKVVEVITGSLRNLLPYSTSSSLIIRNNALLFKTYLEEEVSRNFLRQLKDSMVASLQAFSTGNLPWQIDESTSGVMINDADPHSLGAYFHIPLVLNDRPMGIITIASKRPGIYSEEEMTMLYRITNLALHALSRLEDVLAAEKNKLMATIGSLADGIFMVDIHRELFVINNAAKDFMKITKENPTIVDILSALPNTYDFSSKIEKAIQQKTPIEEKEIHFGEKYFKLFITPVLNPNSRIDGNGKNVIEVLGASILLHDISLEKSIAQMKEDFTNIMVHELRSPLTAIKAATDLMVTQKDKMKTEDGDKLLRLINDQSRKLLDEISTILDAAKLEAGMLVMNKTKADLSKLIAEKITFFTAQAQDKHIILNTDIDPELPGIEYDQRYIELVMNNLLSNSLKFTSIGGKIIISAKQHDGFIFVSVADNGMGIPKDKQASLFSKFTQVNTPNAHVGTGLGLYIVKGIVESHGGTVMLDSDLNKGTTITFSLPITAATATSQSIPQPITTPIMVN